MSDGSSDSAAWTEEAVLPFQVPALDVRGRLVRLGPSIDIMLERHGYPQVVAELLAETLTLAATLASSIKYEGIFTLQIRGEGPVRLIVTDVTSAGYVRGYAQYDKEAVSQATQGQEHLSSPVPRLLGPGTLAFTVDQGANTDRYQGVVSLEGATLADCAHAYFRQSEQLKTGLLISVGQRKDADGRMRWRGAALMVQRLPGEQTPDGYEAIEAEEADDRWRRAVILMSSTRESEMLDDRLPPEDLLFRLYHEDGVHASPARPLKFGCRCSRTRIERVLRSFPKEEIVDLRDDSGRVVVTCEFCLSVYVFDDDDLAQLWTGQTPV